MSIGATGSLTIRSEPGQGGHVVEEFEHPGLRAGSAELAITGGDVDDEALPLAPPVGAGEGELAGRVERREPLLPEWPGRVEQRDEVGPKLAHPALVGDGAVTGDHHVDVE